MTTPLVSVVLPVRNGELYLRKALESIASQTVTNWELIIVDDGSTDGTSRILDEWSSKDKRVRVFFRDPTGLVGALNFGIDECRGQYIARMDADDIALPKRFEVQLLEMQRRPNLMVCGSRVRIIDSKGRQKATLEVPHTVGGCKYSLATYFTIVHPTALFRREIFESFRYTSGGSEELRLFGQIVAKGQDIGNTREVLLHYRVHQNNTNTIHSAVYEEGAIAHTCDYIKSLQLGDVDRTLAQYFREVLLAKTLDASKISYFVKTLSSLADEIISEASEASSEVRRLHLRNMIHAKRLAMEGASKSLKKDIEVEIRRTSNGLSDIIFVAYRSSRAALLRLAKKALIKK